MKKLCTVILYLVAFTAKAQNFGAVGTEWYYSFLSPDAPFPPVNGYVHLKSVGDSVILGKTTNQINLSYYGHVSPSDHQGPWFVYQNGDTAFYYSPERQKFISLYIFNRNAGDTIELDFPLLIPSIPDSTYKQRIDSVTTVMINGVALKKYYTTPLHYAYRLQGTYFMDHIGGNYWYWPLANVLATGYSGPLRCFSNGTISHNFWNLPCDSKGPNNASEELPDTEVCVFPNPASDKIALILPSDAPISGTSSLHITDLTGREITSTKFTGTSTHVDISQLPQGLYLITVTSTKGQSWQQKLLIEK